jgi:hypothetical protein
MANSSGRPANVVSTLPRTICQSGVSGSGSKPGLLDSEFGSC